MLQSFDKVSSVSDYGDMPNVLTLASCSQSKSDFPSKHNSQSHVILNEMSISKFHSEYEVKMGSKLEGKVRSCSATSVQQDWGHAFLDLIEMIVKHERLETKADFKRRIENLFLAMKRARKVIHAWSYFKNHSSPPKDEISTLYATLQKANSLSGRQEFLKSLLESKIFKALLPESAEELLRDNQKNYDFFKMHISARALKRLNLPKELSQDLIDKYMHWLALASLSVTERKDQTTMRRMLDLSWSSRKAICEAKKYFKSNAGSTIVTQADVKDLLKLFNNLGETIQNKDHDDIHWRKCQAWIGQVLVSEQTEVAENIKVTLKYLLPTAYVN